MSPDIMRQRGAGVNIVSVYTRDDINDRSSVGKGLRPFFRSLNR